MKNKNLIFGTWEFDGKHKDLGDAEVKNLLNYAKVCGVYMFDTALVYGDGRVEKLLGEVISEEDYVITKIPASNKPDLDSTDYAGFYSKERIDECLSSSLLNLKREKIDCVLLHNWARGWNKDPAMWLNEYKKTGVVGEVGISLPNAYSCRLSDEILDVVDAIELPYNSDNIWSAEDIDYYKKKGKKIFIRSILSKGKAVDKKDLTSVMTKIKEMAKFGCPLVVGMTTHEQIHDNFLWTANQEDVDNVVKESIFENDKIMTSASGREFCLNNQLFGALSGDYESPLHCVSVSNNSLSIDIWQGCPFQCKYCHVQGIYEDIKKYGKMGVLAERRNSATVKEVVEALFSHPYFIPNNTIISIGTSSTEPLASGAVLESTIEIMQTFVDYGLKNPFWIVTKAGLPLEMLDDIKRIASNGNKIMFSMCYAGNPKEIEPAQNNRLKNIELFKDIENVEIAWYLRPLVEEWGANVENLERMFKEVSMSYGDAIKYIVPGGMRWTEGIEYALSEIGGVELPNLVKEDNIKTLGDDIVANINRLSKEYFPNVELFYNSSCPVSRMLNQDNINMSDCLKNNCTNSYCKKPCSRKIDEKFYAKFSDYIESMGIKVRVNSIENKKIVSVPAFKSLHYVEQQIIKQLMARCLNER